jgi:hypothetical protein
MPRTRTSILRSLKPGETGDRELRSEPPFGKGKLHGLGKNRVVPKNGKFVSTAVREAREGLKTGRH